MHNRFKRNSALPVIAAVSVAAGGCATKGGDDDFIDYTTDTVVYVDVQPEMAAALPGYDDEIGLGLYAAAGLGVSNLNPDTDSAPGIDVNDSIAGAGQITLGLDVNKHFSVEMHSADLGSAGLSPAGRINYHLNGASALYYAGKNRHNRGRRGFTAFGRIGVGAMDNSPIGGISYTRTNDAHVLFGAGFEYNTRFGLGARAELISFDKDAQFAQLGLMYRIGQRNRKPTEIAEVVQAVAPPPAPIVVPPPAPVAIPEPAPAPEPVIAAVIPKDTDRDGVLDRADRCPATPRRSTVDRNGCPVFSGTIEGVNFKTASAELTDQAVDILDDVNRTLRQYPNTQLVIKAHTDSQGEADRNQRLSERRARTVVEFLAKRGIAYDRMTAKAYGERNPIDTNSTAAGRANNRRVEIFASNPQ
jgi:outer membrane protein OmpA-like peptidoglycan-associated protein